MSSGEHENDGESQGEFTATENVEAALSDESGGMAIQVGSGPSGADEFVGSELPDELAILPLKNTVLFPFLLSPLYSSSFW